MPLSSPLSILILENRQMIASILADLLREAGHQPEIATTATEAQEALQNNPPAFFLADRGMRKPEEQQEWEALEEAVQSLEVPVIYFSCAPTPDVPPELVLRSPGDFAGVIERVERELRLHAPLLGTALVEMGRLTQAELDAALRIQQELRGIGKSIPLGELLLRLDLVDEESLQEALHRQES